MRVVNRMAVGKSIKKPPRRPERRIVYPKLRLSAARAAGYSFDFFTHETLDQRRQIVVQPILQHRPQALELYAATPVSELEQVEGLEQLRFLSAGVAVAVVEVAPPPFALRELNNPEDVAPIEQALAQAGLQ